MSKPVDLELKKAFAELQEKMIDTKQKLHFSDMQIEGLKRNKQHAEITEKEISGLNAKTRMYESIGRMFVLADIADVKENLRKRQSNAEEKIQTLEVKKNYLEQSLKDAENNLREMVQHKKELHP